MGLSWVIWEVELLLYKADATANALADSAGKGSSGCLSWGWHPLL